MAHTRTNEDVAAVFQDIADLLEAQGENPFKIRAYRNAVRTLQDLTEPVGEIEARGDLRKIPGFGEAIASKTQEILATGTCKVYERLKTQSAPIQLAGERQKLEIGAALGAKDAESQETLGQEEEDEDVPSPW